MHINWTGKYISINKIRYYKSDNLYRHIYESEKSSPPPGPPPPQSYGFTESLVCETRDFGFDPSGVANSVTERNFLWLGAYHNKHLDTRNKYFPICKINKTSNNKGYRIVPCSRKLK